MLAAVLLDDEYRVLRVGLIPCAVVRERCKFVRHMNSYKFMMTDDVWDDRRVTDVTGKLGRSRWRAEVLEKGQNRRVRRAAGSEGLGKWFASPDSSRRVLK